MSMKKSNDTIGNRTRDLPACSVVPQPTAPPRAPNLQLYLWKQNEKFKCFSIYNPDSALPINSTHILHMLMTCCAYSYTQSGLDFFQLLGISFD
jgi:hypothetical protein